MNNQEKLKHLCEIITSIENLEFNDWGNQDKIQKRIELFIKRVYGTDSEYLDHLQSIPFQNYGYDSESLEENKKTWNEGKKFYKNICEVFIEEIAKFDDQTNDLVKPSELHVISNKIFVVHGHDDEMLYAVESFILTIEKEPIILRKQPNKGRTIIEKFEDYSDVDFAIVLFSPDDEGRAKTEDKFKPRPRQNVVFELGFFIGKLGRNKVVVLHRTITDFEMLSDFTGVLFEPYETGWELKIARELKSAGCEIDLNKLVKI